MLQKELKKIKTEENDIGTEQEQIKEKETSENLLKIENEKKKDKNVGKNYINEGVLKKDEKKKIESVVKVEKESTKDIIEIENPSNYSREDTNIHEPSKTDKNGCDIDIKIQTTIKPDLDKMKNIENIKAFEKEEDKNEKKNLINIGSEGQKFDDSQ